ncbi:hypothetical protein ORV05_32220 [Amycolatopsis cynarae]|uniref:Uncharacterized protein n=1 Tax=Amycolatopsis cynarae TaxID=2995223 RepID=A0ABY7B2N5_9PSEU|nr:hypothetical protein [Amycolatopsis sp. HUAS 11-8]WAL65503.1 hypothetical protein ORV05_32220 [Amycolatopsis sp. HUAS 11-8]
MDKLIRLLYDPARRGPVRSRWHRPDYPVLERLARALQAELVVRLNPRTSAA